MKTLHILFSRFFITCTSLWLSDFEMFSYVSSDLHVLFPLAVMSYFPFCLECFYSFSSLFLNKIFSEVSRQTKLISSKSSHDTSLQLEDEKSPEDIMYNIIIVNNSVHFKMAKRLDCVLTKYIYICVCIYIYTYMYTCIHIYTYTYVYVYIYIYVYMYVYMYTCIHICVYICICIYLCDVIVLSNSTGVLLLQHINVSNYHIVHLKLTQYIQEVKSLSHVWLFKTPWTVAHQAPLSIGFPWTEYWSR